MGHRKGAEATTEQHRTQNRPGQSRSKSGRSTRLSHISHAATSTGVNFRGWYVHNPAPAAKPARKAKRPLGRCDQASSAAAASPANGTVRPLRSPKTEVAISQGEPAIHAIPARAATTPYLRSRGHAAAIPASPTTVEVARMPTTAGPLRT